MGGEWVKIIGGEQKFLMTIRLVGNQNGQKLQICSLPNVVNEKKRYRKMEKREMQ